MPEPQTTETRAREPSRVVVFTGAKGGAGKTTLAVNLALAWAGSQNRKVVIVQMDPLCRNDAGFLLGLSNPPSLAGLLPSAGENVTGLGRLLRGRIPMSQYGVGVLPLGSKRQ